MNIDRYAPQRQLFTEAGVGSVIELGGAAQNFALQVAGRDGAADAWGVDLEGSLDGIHYDTLLTHTTGTGDGKMWFSGNQVYPVLFVRPNVKSLTLGAAGALVVWVMAT